MDIKQLITFKTLSIEQNYIKAAEKLNYAPSTLAKHVHALEDELGVVLLKYKNGRLELTGRGEKLLCRAENILAEYSKLQRDFAKGRRENTPIKIVGGEFIVGFSYGDFFASWPKDDSRMVINAYTACCAQAGDWLRDGRADAAFVEMKDGREEPGCRVIPLFKENICLMAASNHPLAGRGNVTWRQLARCSFAFTYPDCCFTREFEEQLSAHSPKEDYGVYLGSLHSVIRAVLTDGRICLVPASCIDYMENEGLVTLNWKGNIQAVTAVLLPEGEVSPRIKSLVRHAGIYAKNMRRRLKENRIALLWEGAK